MSPLTFIYTDNQLTHVDRQSRDDLITLDSPFSGDLISEPAPPSPFRAPSLASSAASMVASDAGARADLDTADFGTAWAALPSFTARGWSERAVSAAVRRMRSLGYRVVVVASDRPPFEGACTHILFISDTDGADYALGHREHQSAGYT